jgi:uncharacterized protein (DUF2141 family)
MQEVSKMKFLNLVKIVAYINAIVLISSCASVRTPTGGDKDEIAPTLINTIPKHTSTNFIGTKIVLEFDEAVQVNNIQKELIITPKVINPYTAIAKYNKVTITFEKPFKPNTTYTLNFRKAIGDLNENNQPQNLKLVFSTGPEIDSVKFQVSVTDQSTGKPLPKGIATLYEVSDTLDPRKQNPYYFTAIENGIGQFEYLKGGTYTLLVITDNNDNQLYDSYAGERLGFIEKPIVIPRDSISSFKLTREESEPIKIIDKSKYLNSYTLEFNKTPVKLSSDLSKEYYSTLEQKKWAVYRSITSKTDSLETIITTADSANNISIDTVKLYFSGKKANPRIQEQLYKPVNNPSLKLKPRESLTLTIKDSVINLNKDGFLVRYDTNKYEAIIPTLKGRELTFPLKAAKKASLVFKGNSIKTILNDTNKSDTLKIGYIAAEELGSITYKVKQKPNRQYIVQLLTENDKLVAELKEKETGTFYNLEPGNYKIRYYSDKDKNGIPTIGNFKKQQEAEEIYTYKELIPIKANWEITDISW